MKKYSTQEATGKIQRYCAYQERSHLEVRQKLFEYGMKEQETDEIVTNLITSGFLNEERYAKAFAGGKFRMKKWGRLKIIRALESQGLTKNCIKAGLTEIDQPTYEDTLRQLLIKKAHQVDEKIKYVQRDKVAKFALLKGYEPELIWELLKEIVPD